jgi:hypothetical protein
LTPQTSSTAAHNRAGLPPEQYVLARSWCRNLDWPRVGTADSEGMDRFGPLGDVRTSLICEQIEALMLAYRLLRQTGVAAPAALQQAANARVAELANADPSLALLPLLCCIAGRARADHQLACLQAAGEEIARSLGSAPVAAAPRATMTRSPQPTWKP